MLRRNAINNGTGAVSVTSTGTVIGNGFDGIFARNNGTDGTDLTVNWVKTN